MPDRNPFIAGSALSPDSPMFFGREREFGEVRSALLSPDKPGCVSVLGERYSGKSSFLNHVRISLTTEPGLVCIWSTNQDWSDSSPARFFSGIHHAIVETLAQKDGSDASRGQSDDLAVAGYTELRDAVHQLSRLGLRFVLALDDMENISRAPAFDAEFFSNLRALGDVADYQFGYLISSYMPLADLCRSSRMDAPFWDLFGIPHYLGLLDEAAATSLVKQGLSQTLPPNLLPDVDELWSERIEPLTGRNPYLIQMALSAYWNAFSRGAPPPVSRIDLDVSNFLNQLWLSRQDPQEWRVLTKAAWGTRQTSGGVARWLRLRGLLLDDGRVFSDSFARFIRALPATATRHGEQREGR